VGVEVHAATALKFTSGNSREIALFDLNGDGFEERITRICNENSCAYTILAKIDSENFMTIGEMDAHHIAISNDQQNGVRAIRAYKDEMNDYNYMLYLWDAENSRYIKQ
jgi:hypothetical protein